MQKETSIAQVLAEIDITVQSGEPVYFSLEFWKVGRNANDPERGKIVSIERASKNFKSPEVKTENKSSDNGREFYRLKEQGILLIFDHLFYTKNKKTGFTSVVIDLIKSYNGMKVIH